MSYRILSGDALTVLRTLPENSAHCIVTSPPYYAQRRYKAGPAEMGSEATPEEHIAALVAVFRECRRVLRPDGTMWVNYGDKAANSGAGESETPKQASNTGSMVGPSRNGAYRSGEFLQLPWKLALALRDDGWVLHPEVIWHKPAPMPESVSGTRWEQHRVKVAPSTRAVTSYLSNAKDSPEGLSKGGGVDGSATWADCTGCARCEPNGGLVLRRGSWRPTRSHEYIFMLTKSEEYYADQDAVREVAQDWGMRDRSRMRDGTTDPLLKHHGLENGNFAQSGRNVRSVWTIGPEPLRVPHDYTAKVDVSHFAAFPTELPTRCIKVSTSEKGVCPTCGAPYARVIERPAMLHVEDSELDRYGTGMAGVHRKVGQAYQDWREANPDKTLAWRPTCSHGDLVPVPSTVLDPFSGAGSTVLAAVRLGRDAIGIELREEYAALSQARIVEDAPMLAGGTT